MAAWVPAVFRAHPARIALLSMPTHGPSHHALRRQTTCSSNIILWDLRLTFSCGL